jgi:cellulose synthase/poly-beta-1,6-N-acetylglucosamine synthase-like glycosyltransferase
VLEAFAIVVSLCALIPALLFCVNLRRYSPPGPAGATALPSVSVLIPARDEERVIGAAIRSVLASAGVQFEVVVMDDGSSDRTGAIVSEIAVIDNRVRLERAPPLPPGWNGKQHACWALAQASRYELLCFMDADVRLEPEALPRMASFLIKGQRALVSGFPRQETGTWLEWLLLPLIHFVLLGFLPMGRMRSTTDPALAAGCGQFLLVQRSAYFACGGHSEIRTTLHDGLMLPRLFRRHGYRTDLADLTELATCRMYRSARQVWFGLAKNATEGIAAPTRIVPISLLLVMGQVLPFCLALWFAVRGGASLKIWIYIWVGVVSAWLPRFLGAVRFRQSWRGAVLHPIGILTLLSIQWYALSRRVMGRTVNWKTRNYASQ